VAKKVYDVPMGEQPFQDELAGHLAGADHVDVHTVTGPAGLEQFVVRALAYQPWWLAALYRLRAGLARLMGLNRQGMTAAKPADPTRVMIPGARLGVFTVIAASPGRWWVGQHEDRHLTARLAMACREEASGVRRFWAITAVWHHNWRGPLYLALVRPFHHLVVWAMCRRAARGA